MALDLIAPGDWQKIVPDGAGDAYLTVGRSAAARTGPRPQPRRAGCALFFPLSPMIGGQGEEQQGKILPPPPTRAGTRKARWTRPPG